MLRRFYSKYRQVISSIILGLVIIFAYFYVANSFATIAQNALEYSVQVKLGALSEASVPLLDIVSNDQALLREHISKIVSKNDSVLDAKIIQKTNLGWQILYEQKNKTLLEGTSFNEYADVFDRALQNPSTVFFRPITENNQKRFVSAKAISTENKQVLFIKTNLDEVYQNIYSRLYFATIILFLTIIVVIFLFIHHARIIDYASLYKQLKEIDQMKDDFISIASHELRTPLTAIRGYIELLNDSLQNKTPDIAEFIHKIAISAKSLSELIDDILDVSRIQQGRLQINIESVNPKAILDDVLSQLKVIAEQKGLFLYSNIENDLCIHVDPKRFRQIALNIIGNAIKYTKQGKVEVSLYKQSGFVKFVVKDTGVGMSKEEIEHLFTKFWRAKSVSSKNIKGTGLGMWITKQLIDAMNGEIKVYSKPGVGTQFEVIFKSCI